MSNVFKPKRSIQPGAIPSVTDLVENEIAVNTIDRVIYTRSGDSIVPIANFLDPTGNGATGATGVQGATGIQGATGPLGGGFFVIFAERNNAYSPGNEFAFGNGGNNERTGVIITEDCILRSISIAANSANIQDALRFLLLSTM